MLPFIIVALLVVFVTYLIFKTKMSVKTPKDQTIDYCTLLNDHIAYYQKLSEVSKIRFENLIADFLQNVKIEGVGTDITDIDRVMIASSAVIPVFGFPDWQYKNLTNIILYPDTFDHEFQFEGKDRNILGMVGSGYMNGQMLLSRAALVKGFSKLHGRENVAIHEFVHLLDKADGITDGALEILIRHEYTIPWFKMMHQEMHRIEIGKSDINLYALTNEAEFLAVAGEYFFEKPEELKHKHPDLYHRLTQLFGQDPSAAVNN